MKCPIANCRGAEHLGLCHQCPHDGDKSLAALPWPKHPCQACGNAATGVAACDSREQGHGRGISYEAAPPGDVAMPAPPSDEPPTALDAVRVVLHQLAKLTPKEYIALIEYARTDDGEPRTLCRVAAVVKGITREKHAVSFQMIDMILASAKKKLGLGAREAAKALRL